MDLCWSCNLSEYHDYKDIHGIRCPRCGQKEKDDPAKKPIEQKPSARAVRSEAPRGVVKTAKKTTARRKT